MALIQRLSKSQLVRGSLLLFVGNNVASVGNFLYNLFMGRMLGPALYGDLGVLFSLFILLSTPLAILQMVSVKIISTYYGEGSLGKIRFFLDYMVPRVFLATVVAAGVMLVASRGLSAFVNGNVLALNIFILCFLLSGPITIYRGVLQGMLLFPVLTINTIIETLVKNVIAVMLVFFHFQIVGAVLGVLTSIMASGFLMFVELRKRVFQTESQRVAVPASTIYKTGIPVFLGSLCLSVFMTVDTILVRIFFTASLAGEYVALATAGKIVYYAVGPVISVMFPLVSSRAKRGVPYLFPLLGTLVIALTVAVFVISGFFLFPKLIVTVLFGDRYYYIIPYLGMFSLYMTVFTVNSILTYFLISISHYKPFFILFPVVFLQATGIFFFHENIAQVVWVNLIVSLAYLLFALYFVAAKEYKEIKRYTVIPLKRLL